MDKPTVQQKLEQRKLKPVNPAAFRFMRFPYRSVWQEFPQRRSAPAAEPVTGARIWKKRFGAISIRRSIRKPSAPRRFPRRAAFCRGTPA